LLVDLAEKHNYLTRLNTVISPEEMTLDPVFGYDSNREDVSNIRDLSDHDKDLYECDRDPNFQPVDAESNTEESEGGGIINIPFFGSGSDDNSNGNDNSAVSNGENNTDSGSSNSFRTGILVGVGIMVLAGAFVVIGAGIWLIRRSSR
jgi:hypothetical protein